MTVEQQLEEAQAALATANTQVAALTERATLAEAEALKAIEERDAEKARADKAEAELASTEGAYQFEKEGRETLQKRVEKLEADAKSAEVRAAEICASARIPALPLGAGGPVKAGKETPAPLTKAEFDALPSTEKAEFARKGGVIEG